MIIKQLYPTALKSVNDCLCTVFNAKLAQDGSHMILNCLMADSKKRSDLFIAHPFNNAGKYFHLTI